MAELGFRWANANSDTRWEEYYNVLKKYKEENGHCNVPQLSSNKLGIWLHQQVCVCIYAYVCMYACMHMAPSAGVCVYMHIYLCMYACMYAYGFISRCLCAYVCMYVCMHMASSAGV